MYNVNTAGESICGATQIETALNMEFLHQICQEQAYDLTDKFIVGFGLHDSAITMGVQQAGMFACSILTIDQKKYGSSPSDIEQTLRLCPTAGLQITKYIVWISYLELNKLIDSFEFLFTSELVGNIDNIEIIDAD